jgi:hypothetical protein
MKQYWTPEEKTLFFFVYVFLAVLAVFAIYVIVQVIYETIPYSLYIVVGAITSWCSVYKVFVWLEKKEKRRK